ncbi:MAG: ribosome recycling factor [Oscillospiraceae bacterium]|jgi:ribosome recycling factor|nr:ribosome recycling factor [Oscillospiraceae bacterium]
MANLTLDAAKDKMGKTTALLKKELASLRAGRANPQLLDRIVVDYYGTPTPLSRMANISAPEARQLVIAPWDPKLISTIEKEIQKSDLGMTPSNDGKIIRLTVPELNEERRRELNKLVKKLAEEAKVAVRSIRRDAVESIKKQEKAGELTEDDRKKAEADAQKIHDAAIKEVDAIAAEKEKEIMTV